MNLLVLKAGQRRIECAYFADTNAAPERTAFTQNLRETQDDDSALRGALRKIHLECRLAMNSEPDGIAVCAPFGGAGFERSVIVDAEVLGKLRTVIPQAPFHTPLLLRLLQACGEIFSGVPVTLSFQTAFFAKLPLRERLYAVEPDLCAGLGGQRTGYQGLFHEAACEQVSAARRKSGVQEPARTLSICLEPQPEVAGVFGRQPVMVSSGASSLEGIPGETTCGLVDPSLVLILAETLKCGPERINQMLTQESGLRGLLDKPATLPDVFEDGDADCERARRIIEYRILQACGAGIAALGGLDAIVFSGRYASLGEKLGPWLCEKLRLNNWQTCSLSLARIVAAKSALLLQTSKNGQAVGS
ncbi:MAG TPA: hypothetical protein VGP72_32240 [Planctomycetota bacterium]|jgi:acetate kinase